MSFCAYVTDSNIDPAFHVNKVKLEFVDLKTADEWWCAISEIPKLAEAIRRIKPSLYTNDTTKFDITTFFNSFDATIRAISQRFSQKLIITLVSINDPDEPDDHPHKPSTAIAKRANGGPTRVDGNNGNGNRNWVSVHSTTNSEVSWDPTTDPCHVRVSQSNRTMFQVANQPHPRPQAGNRNPQKNMQKAPLRYTSEDRLSLNLELPDSVSDPSSFFEFLNINANRNGAGVPVDGLNGLVEGFGGLVINAVNVNGPSNRLGFMGPNGNGEVSHPPAPKRCLKPVNPIPVPEGPPPQPPNANGKGKAKACCFATRPLKKSPPAGFKAQPQTVPAVALPSGGGPHPVASGSVPGGDPHHGCGAFGHGSPRPAWCGWGREGNL